MSEPASIRYKNPGAMWGRKGKRLSDANVVVTDAPIPKRWGSKETVYLKDGMGQGNNIAVFETWVDGICAQLDLWRSSSLYKNKKFSEAIAVWSGGNYVESYIKFVLDRVPGMTRNTIMNDAFWRSQMGIQFLKAQAWHEAGKQYPAPDADWVEAQRIVMDVKALAKPPATSTTTKLIVAASTGAATAVASGWAWPDIIPWLVGAAVVIGVGIGIYWAMTKEE